MGTDMFRLGVDIQARRSAMITYGQENLQDVEAVGNSLDGKKESY